MPRKNRNMTFPVRLPATFRPATLWLTAPLFIGIGGCNDNPDTGPGAVSEGEAAALDEAAEMLDARQLPPEAIPEVDAPIAPTPSQSEAESD
ncbi:MAG: hypothetical protein ABJP48_04060 [Erythrobacter sp.]